MKKIEAWAGTLSAVLGGFTAVILILMALNVAYDALSRYLFNTNSVALQELEWHLFSVIILLGLSYALHEEAHVRVDVLYTHFSEKTKAIINMAGVVLFVLPLACLVAFGSLGFVAESYDLLEQSGDPGGLPYRFVIKSLIPISFFILLFSSLGYFARYYNKLQALKKEGQA